MTSTKELTIMSNLHRASSSVGAVISLASAEDSIVSINDNMRVLSRLNIYPNYVKSRTDFVIVFWYNLLEQNTTMERGIRISKDVSVPIENAVVVCKMNDDTKMESVTNLEMNHQNEEKLNFFGNILSLQQMNKIDTALRTMFREIDQFILNEKIDLCNELFTDPRSKSFNKDIQIGLLAITLPWKSKLPNRFSYINFVRSTLQGIYSKEKTEKLLSGLI